MIAVARLAIFVGLAGLIPFISAVLALFLCPSTALWSAAGFTCIAPEYWPLWRAFTGQSRCSVKTAVTQCRRWCRCCSAKYFYRRRRGFISVFAVESGPVHTGLSGVVSGGRMLDENLLASVVSTPAFRANADSGCVSGDCSHLVLCRSSRLTFQNQVARFAAKALR